MNKPSRFPWPSFLAVAFTLAGGSSARALSVAVKGPDGQPAGKIDFGVLSSSAPFNTAPQYLEIIHPGLSFRRIYLHSDNGAGFGLAQGGLVSTRSVVSPSLPLYFRNFISSPTASTVKFTAAEASFWPSLADSPAVGFDGSVSPFAPLSHGSELMSWVYFGLEIPSDFRQRGGFGARLVVEDWSENADVTGPTAVPLFFSTLILVRDIPVGVGATLTDQTDVTDYTLYYRLWDGPAGFQSAKGNPPEKFKADSGSGPFAWKGSVDLDPSFLLRAPGVLEYYFTAVDTFSNVTTSARYLCNLVPDSGAASLPYSAGAGGVSVAIGDLRWPGLEVQFPAGSLRSGGTLTVSLRNRSTVPPMDSKMPARVFQLGPNDPGFNRPVTLLLPYLDRTNDGKEDETEAKETDLRVFWFDGFDWRYVGGSVDAEKNQVRASVTRLGEYALFPFSTSLTEDLVRPKEHILTFNYPNDFLRFTGMDPTAGSFEIKIFDIRGNLVRKIQNSPDWDGRDESGRRVESGTYVYRMEGQGLTLSGMIAVAR